MSRRFSVATAAASTARRTLDLRPLTIALTLLVALPTGAAAAAGRTLAPAAGHDVTRPWITSQVSDEIASSTVSGSGERGPVVPLQTRPAAHPAAAGQAVLAGAPLDRELLGFARATSLDDPDVGYRTWNLSLLSDIAYFGVHVNSGDGNLVRNDAGWNVWQSGTASGLINAAHAKGVRVLLTLMMLVPSSRNLEMCAALDHGQATIDAVAAQLRGADGIDIDYEAGNQRCPDSVSLRTKLVQFVRQVRARNLGYLVIDTYSSSAADPGGFFDIPSLAGSVDAFFVMDYDMEYSNGPCGACMGPTSPLEGASPSYTWNVTRSANGYAPWAGKTLLGFPYYGVAGCVGGPNPGANAPVISGASHYTALPYTVTRALGSNPDVAALQVRRDPLDPGGQEAWGTYYASAPSLGCWREAYWDDPTSLAQKHSLVQRRGFRGAGFFTLDYGGGAPELWTGLAQQYTAFHSLGGVFTSSPAAASWGPSRLDAFGRAGDGALWHAGDGGGGWSGWQSLGGGLRSAPAAVSWGPGRIDVFVRGLDDALWHIAWTGSAWSGWQNLGGLIDEAPAVSSWGPDRLDVFARGRDGGLWHLAWDGSRWSAWQPLGGLLSAGPGAASWGPGRIDVFARGSDAGLWHRAWDGSTWTGWAPMGAALEPFAPAVASTAGWRLDVTLPAPGGALARDAWDGAAWSGPQAMAGPSMWHMGPATVAPPGSGHVATFVVGPDDAIWVATG